MTGRNPLALLGLLFLAACDRTSGEWSGLISFFGKSGVWLAIAVVLALIVGRTLRYADEQSDDCDPHGIPRPFPKEEP